MKVFLSRVHFPVTTLGFGRRVGIWFQGCSIQCPGCVSRDTWAFGKGATTIAAICDVVRPWLGEADGVTISGGEPFDQPEGLRALLQWLRPRVSGDVLVFSGYAFERLGTRLAAMSGLIDVLISDPFDANATQTLALRGSDNQRVHLLTEIGRLRYADLPTMKWETSKPALDVVIEGDTVWMAGIPRRGDMQRLKELLAEAGFEGATSEEEPHILA